MSFFSLDALKSAWDSASAAAATLSLDNLQQQFGADEATGRAKKRGDLDLTYLTPRIIGAARAPLCGLSCPPSLLTPAGSPPPRPRPPPSLSAAMGFPSSPTSRLRSRNDITAVAAHFQEEHGAGNVMVWNLSEETYDYALFEAQVVEVRCEGSPAPPLGLMAKVCQGVETWLAADPAHVAAIRAWLPPRPRLARARPRARLSSSKRARPHARPPTHTPRTPRARLHDGQGAHRGDRRVRAHVAGPL
jgi:hypothetical protein